MLHSKLRSVSKRYGNDWFVAFAVVVALVSVEAHPTVRSVEQHQRVRRVHLWHAAVSATSLQIMVGSIPSVH